MAHNSEIAHSSLPVPLRIVAAAGAIAGLHSLAPTQGESAQIPRPNITASVSADLSPESYTAEMTSTPDITDNENTADTKKTSIETATSLHFPNQALNYMDKNTVYLTGLGCSGDIIRAGGQTTGKPIGVAFARHCGFVPNAPSEYYWYGGTYVKGTNNKLYTVKSFNIIAETGANQNQMQPIGEINEVVVPPESNETSDQVYGVLPGASASEVIASYKEQLISEDDIYTKLTPGKTKVYTRGWPVNQTGNEYGVEIAQQFAMPYIGQLTTYTQSGETLSLIVTAVPKIDSKVDDATCSFGNSGAQGFILDGDKETLLGPLSVFWGLMPLIGSVDSSVYNNATSPEENKNYLKEQFPEVNWDKYSAACGFAYQAPAESRTLHVVLDNELIPGGIDPEAARYNRMENKFSDPNYTRTIVDGTLFMKQYSEKGGGDSGIIETVIKRPIISVESDGSVYIGFYDKYDPGHISVLYFPNIDGLTFYKNNGADSIDLIKSSGAITYKDGSSRSYNPGRVVDAAGLSFGEYEQKIPKPVLESTPYEIVKEKGHLKLIPAIK